MPFNKVQKKLEEIHTLCHKNSLESITLKVLLRQYILRL